MSKFKVDSKVDTIVANGQADATGAVSGATAEVDGAAAHVQAQDAEGNELLTNIVTIGVVGVGAALIEAALIPGIVIGVAAAFAPKYVPQIGSKLRPLFKSTLGGVVRLSQKAREAVAETKEQMQDLVAEVKAEQQKAGVAPVAPAAAEPAAAHS
jgi:hypothetical protein